MSDVTRDQLREPCPHGRYDEHLTGRLSDRRCPGGRTLTHTETLERLLYNVCRECAGSGMTDAGPPFACPFCDDGSGLISKAGVAPDCGWYDDDCVGDGCPAAKEGAHGFWIPATMLEGDTP